MMEDVRVRVPGALDPAIKTELFKVVDEFLKGSLAWKEEVEIPTVVGTRDYDIVPDKNGLIWQLIGAEDTTTHLPVFSGMPVPGELRLEHPPTQVVTLKVVVAMTVNAPTTRDGFPIVPIWLCDRYAQSAWADGVLGKMHSQPAKPYTNQAMSVYHLRRFANSIAKAKVDAAHQNTYRGQSWSFPQQFRVRHRWG